MNPLIPKSEADLIPIDVAAMIDRFARAKWITGINIAHPDFYALHFTKLGRGRMRQLEEAIRPFDDCVLNGAQRPGIMSYLRFFYRLSLISYCLRPPAFSKGEVNALVGIAVMLGRKRRFNTGFSAR